MAKEKEILQDAKQVFCDEEMLAIFSAMIERRSALKAAIKEAEKEVGYTDDKKVRHPGLDDEIIALMEVMEIKKLQYKGLPVSITQGSRSSLSKEKLLLAGVAASVIQAAMVETKYTYLLIGKAKV